MPSRLTGFVCPTVSMVTTGHATGVEKTLLRLPLQGHVVKISINSGKTKSHYTVAKSVTG